jgi:PTS system mannose-specific IIB component
MFLAMPCGTRLDVKSVKDSITALLNGSYNGERLIVLTANPKDLFLMIEKGVELKSINAGGMHFTDGKRQLLYNLFADNEDVEYLHKIYLKDIEIEGRVLPMDERTSIVSIIEREYQIIHRG